MFVTKMKFLRLNLNKQQLRSIHFQSVSNFLEYFSSLTNQTIQNQIIKLLNDYFNDIKEKNYDLNQNESNAIFDLYIAKIGIYYNVELHFKVYMRLKWALFIGLNLDLLLLIFGVLSKIWFIPVVTLIFTGYMLYLNMFYKKRNKIYGFEI